MRKNSSISRAYAFFAPAYDFFFGRVLEPGRRLAIQMLEPKPEQRILEVGVGTGMSLASYPHHTRVTGIDLAPEMLAKAQARIERGGLKHVDRLIPMDATNMQFEDNGFDAAICMYVVSVVPDPLRVMEEMSRVCKPGGKLVVVNHFKTNSPLIRAAEVALKPIHYMVRFRADLELEDFRNSVGLPLEKSRRANVMGYSTVLVFRNEAPTGTS